MLRMNASPGPRRARRPAGEDRDARQAILDATRALLGQRRFDELSVADILAAAGVSRGTFYFYFAGKPEVLADLVRDAIRQGQEAARPWLARSGPDEHYATVRHGISEGARLWRAQAPVLRAIVENWRGDPELTGLWLQMMGGFTAATAARIRADSPGGLPVDADALAGALTWLGERLYYLAAIGVAPFDDQDVLVSVLTHIWMSSVYGD
jgi:TetR/AcrR family transcriptional regulator, ethionamide resistance regulator